MLTAKLLAQQRQHGLRRMLSAILFSFLKADMELSVPVKDHVHQGEGRVSGTDEHLGSQNAKFSRFRRVTDGEALNSESLLISPG